MIGQLNGVLLQKKPPFLMLDVGGVGYELQASMNTFYQLPDVGQKVRLFTQLQMRDDGLYLYGFIDEQERVVYRELIKVNGVGPKLALALLSGMNVAELIVCIQEQNLTRLTAVPGVGKKTAERLLVEMRDRLVQSKTHHPSFSEVCIKALEGTPQANAMEDAACALVSLGYKAVHAHRAVQQVAQKDMDGEQIIRLALQILAKGGS